MPVGNTERDRIFAGFAGDGGKRRANMWVEHRELELHVFDARVRFPDVGLGVVLRDVRREGLHVGAKLLIC